MVYYENMRHDDNIVVKYFFYYLSTMIVGWSHCNSTSICRVNNLLIKLLPCRKYSIIDNKLDLICFMESG